MHQLDRPNRYRLGVVDDHTWYATVAQLRNATDGDLRYVLRNNFKSMGDNAHTNPRATYDGAVMVRKVTKEMMVRQAREIRTVIAAQKGRLRRLTPKK